MYSIWVLLGLAVAQLGSGQPITSHLSLLSDPSLSAAVLKAAQRSGPDCEGDASGTAWIQEYAKWHAANLGKPGAKYFIFFCGEGDLIQVPPGMASSKQQRHCATMGDRFRGLMESVRLAYYSKRVFLAYWGSPAAPEPLEAMLLPSTIDWRVKTEYQIGTTLPHCVYVQPELPKRLKDGRFVQEDAHCPVVAVSHKGGDSKGKYVGPSLGEFDSNARSCLWRALFKPNPQLVYQATDARKQLMGDVVRPYVAIHLRLGGLVDSEDLYANRKQPNPLEAFLTSLQCASHLALSYNMTTPILVLTDYPLMKNEVARGRVQGVVGPKYKTTTHRGKNSDTLAATHASFVDLGLMAGASCMLTVTSGFTQVARVWGGHTCHLQVIDCAKIVDPADQQNAVRRTHAKSSRHSLFRAAKLIRIIASTVG